MVYRSLLSRWVWVGVGSVWGLERCVGAGRCQAEGTIQDRTVDWSPTSRHITTSIPSDLQMTRGKIDASLPSRPTAVAASVRICGLIILPTTPPALLAAAEDRCFFAEQADGRRRDREVLRADHLTDDTAGAVGADEQQRVEAGLMRRGLLQRCEQGVGRGVRTRHGRAQPAEDRREEGEESSGAGDPGADRDGL